ncbi:MAG: glutamate-5-semialdehyde dehydrogenase [Hyphomicrobiales bacterium]
MARLEDNKTQRQAAPGTGDIAALMLTIGSNARGAARHLAQAPTEAKNQALRLAAVQLREQCDAVLAANALDLARARDAGQTDAFIDRLCLDQTRVEAIAQGLEAIADLPDPVGATMAEWQRPNGLHFTRVRVPLGVIGIIYESRPNVTADAGALCMKAGNAAILRGGSDSSKSAGAIHKCLVAGLEGAGLPAHAIQLVPTTDRQAVGEMLKGLGGNLDVIVPRGGKSLVARVEEQARVPVFSHLEGLCHVYVGAGADLDMAIDIAINSKMRRTGVCGAAETLLVDRAVATSHLKPLIGALIGAGCAVRGDDDTQNADPRATPAQAADWDTEYLDAIISVRVVDDIDDAIAHIAVHGSSHTDAIVTRDEREAERFAAQVDSAIVLWNASTQFADGGEFGFGAEIGIATGKMHARGPVGLEQLTSFKYLVRGTGQTRP